MSRKAAVFFLSAALLLLPASAGAYEDDVHYSLTYYLARVVGYTPEQATRIASANLSTDYDSDTEPVRLSQQAAWETARLGISDRMSGRTRQLAADTQQARVDFHAFIDCLNFDSCLSNPAASAVIMEKHAVLLGRARSSGNPGVLLHFMQDETSHAGYPSDNGHVAAVDVSLWDWGGMPLGHTTDYISYPGHHYTGRNPHEEALRRNRPPVENTLIILKDLMEQNFRGKPMTQKPRKFSYGHDALPAFKAAIAANPDPAPGFTKEVIEPGNPYSAIPGVHQIMTLNNVNNWRVNMPKRELLEPLLNDLLNSTLKATDRIPPPISYPLDSNGLPAGESLDQWVLWGDLSVKLRFYQNGEEIAKVFKPVKITAYLVPAFRGAKDEKLVELDIRDGETHTFVNLPIGDLAVEMSYENRKPVRRTLTLRRRTQEITFTLDLDKTDDELPGIPQELLDLLDRIKKLAAQSDELARDADAKLAEMIRELGTADSELGALLAGFAGWEEKIRWFKGEISAIEKALYDMDAIVQRIVTARTRITEAEEILKQQDCPPAQVIETQVRTAEGAVTEVQSAHADLKALEARAAKLSADIAGLSASGLLQPANNAAAALDRASALMDELTDIAGKLEAIRNEGDEIMKRAVEIIRDNSKHENLKDELKRLQGEFEYYFNLIEANWKKWRNVRLESVSDIDRRRKKIEEGRARADAVAAELAGLQVPVFDDGGGYSEAETAFSTKDAVIERAKTLADCPDRIAAIEPESGDKLIGLEIEIEPASPAREDGTAEYNVTAVVTASLREPNTVTCIASHNRGTPVASRSASQAYIPETFRIPLARGDFRTGDTVTVECFAGQDDRHKKTATRRIDGPAPAPQLDCSGYPNTEPGWDPNQQKTVCVCIAGHLWASDGVRCVANAPENIGQLSCADFPHTIATWDAPNKTARCVCAEGFVPQGSDCVPDAQDPEAQVRRKDCSGYPNTYPAWNEQAGAPDCQCNQGFEPAEDGSGCVPLGQGGFSKQAAEYCLQVPNSVPKISTSRDGKARADCVCPSGYEFNGPRTACQPTRQTQVAQTDCSQYGPYAESFWDGSQGAAMCRCVAGTVFDASNRCVPAPQQPQPQFNPNAMIDMINQVSQQMGNNNPPPAQNSGGSTGMGWVNQGYQAPASSGGGHTHSSPGVDTTNSPGGAMPCVSAFGQSDNC